MVEASGGQIAKVARELNVHDSSLGNWVRQARERDILGKAVAYFSGWHPKNV
jgi:transposase-like protein